MSTCTTPHYGQPKPCDECGYPGCPEWVVYRQGINVPDDAIEVRVGNMRLAFPADTPQATIDKKVKQVQGAAQKGRREAARHLKMDPLPKPLKRPTVAMLADTGTIQSDHSEEGKAYIGKGKPILVMPEELRREAMVDLARKRFTAWLKDPKGDPDAARYTRPDMSTITASMTDEQLERLIESNVKPGARLVGKYAATLVLCWDERERRKARVAA